VAPLTGQRSYGDPCGIARALDLIGDRWALLIVRELSFGPKRFTDLKAGLAAASPNVLSQRLRELEAGGVVQRRRAGGARYELTAWGRELHPLLIQMGRWGARSPQRPSGALSVDALMLALEATFVPMNAAELRATYELRLDGEAFAVHVNQGALDISGGSPRSPDAVIDTDPGTLRALVFGDLALAAAPIEIRGNARLARKLFRLFARPPSISPA
jgi:DNA-binding HxlR family transcriptional regulator